MTYNHLQKVIKNYNFQSGENVFLNLISKGDRKCPN